MCREMKDHVKQRIAIGVIQELGQTKAVKKKQAGYSNLREIQ